MATKTIVFAGKRVYPFHIKEEDWPVKFPLICDTDEEVMYANQLHAAIEAGIITGPGYYGIEVTVNEETGEDWYNVYGYTNPE